MVTMSRTLLVAFMALLLVVSPCHARPAPQQTSNKLSAKEKAVAGGVTAIYNFGDSLSDTGNLLREGATGMLQYTTGPPYGSAIGGATGRCSDGYLMIDFLAKDLGLPLLNPYLDKGADFAHGVNFAVAGATALDAAVLARRGVAVPHTNSSLAVQLQQFKDFMNANTRSPQEMREKLSRSLVMVGEIGGEDYNYAFSANKPAGNGERNLYNFGRIATGVVEAMALVPDVVRAVTSTARELLDMGASRLVIPGNFPLGCVPSYMSAGMREKLSRSLVMVGEIGGNDYNYAFSANKPAGNGERNLYNFGRIATGVVEAMALVPDVVRAVTSTARELLDMGATQLVIPGNFPLGCVPSYMSAVNEKDPAAYDANGCLMSLNLFAQMHNVLLQQEIRELCRSYPAATIAYGDYFYAYVRMLRDAGKTGFDEEAVTKACCGGGGGAYNFDMERMCGAPGASVCARPEERISWDGVHLTQRAYRVMIDLLYHKGFASPAPVEFPRA